ncbi:MAG: rhodanese-like domain-containing protein [Pseudomonadota bacterium]|nr:rhodanese-like domain-containing protein [Pseudomonadota bacterium]|tara:strand:+ start:647 stop:970 length:324 start_codon:yes stop_codon:yes gene_type:complete
MIDKTPNQIEEIINDKAQDTLILDVREHWEYDICHIDNSLHIPMGQLIERLDEVEKDKILIVVCHHGIRSRVVGQYLSSNGFNNVLNLNGGLDKWAKEIDKGMSRYV